MNATILITYLKVNKVKILFPACKSELAVSGVAQSQPPIVPS